MPASPAVHRSPLIPVSRLEGLIPELQLAVIDHLEPSGICALRQSSSLLRPMATDARRAGLFEPGKSLGEAIKSQQNAADNMRRGAWRAQAIKVGDSRTDEGHYFYSIQCEATFAVLADNRIVKFAPKADGRCASQTLVSAGPTSAGQANNIRNKRRILDVICDHDLDSTYMILTQERDLTVGVWRCPPSGPAVYIALQRTPGAQRSILRYHKLSSDGRAAMLSSPLYGKRARWVIDANEATLVDANASMSTCVATGHIAHLSATTLSVDDPSTGQQARCAITANARFHSFSPCGTQLAVTCKSERGESCVALFAIDTLEHGELSLRATQTISPIDNKSFVWLFGQRVGWHLRAKTEESWTFEYRYESTEISPGAPIWTPNKPAPPVCTTVAGYDTTGAEILLHSFYGATSPVSFRHHWFYKIERVSAMTGHRSSMIDVEPELGRRLYNATRAGVCAGAWSTDLRRFFVPPRIGDTRFLVFDFSSPDQNISWSKLFQTNIRRAYAELMWRDDVDGALPSPPWSEMMFALAGTFVFSLIFLYGIAAPGISLVGLVGVAACLSVFSVILSAVCFGLTAISLAAWRTSFGAPYDTLPELDIENLFAEQADAAEVLF